MSEELIAKWLDDRHSLDEAEAAELVRVLTADPASAQMVLDQLRTEDLVSRRLGVDRRNFEKQVAQRIIASGSEGTFLKSTIDAVEQSSRRRPWRAWLPEAAAAAVLVVGLMLLLLRKEEPAQRLFFGSSQRGLKAQYFRGQSLEGSPVERVDPALDFSWKPGSPPIPTTKDVYSARWRGWLTPTVTGRHTIHARYDDGVRIWLDGKLLLDDWKGRYVIVDRQVPIDLEAGKPCELKVEYFNGGDRGVLQLSWTPPGLPEETIPESALSH